MAKTKLKFGRLEGKRYSLDMAAFDDSLCDDSDRVWSELEKEISDAHPEEIHVPERLSGYQWHYIYEHLSERLLLLSGDYGYKLTGNQACYERLMRIAKSIIQGNPHDGYFIHPINKRRF